MSPGNSVSQGILLTYRRCRDGDEYYPDSRVAVSLSSIEGVEEVNGYVDILLKSGKEAALFIEYHEFIALWIDNARWRE